MRFFILAWCPPAYWRMLKKLGFPIKEANKRVRLELVPPQQGEEECLKDGQDCNIMFRE